MQMTIKEALYKIETMRIIVSDIESGGSIDYRANEIAGLLDEYIQFLSNTKVYV